MTRISLLHAGHMLVELSKQRERIVKEGMRELAMFEWVTGEIARLNGTMTEVQVKTYIEFEMKPSPAMVQLQENTSDLTR